MRQSVNLTKKILLNSLADYLFRGLCMLLSVYSLKVNLDYLGPTLYGVWVTIASVSQWMVYADLGIGNGFRNELAKAVALGDEKHQKEIIVTSICMLTKVALGLLVLITVVTEGLIRANVLDAILRAPMYITNVFFCINFLLGLVSPAAYAYQEGWISSLNGMMTSLLRITIVLILLSSSVPADLVLFATLNGLSSVVGCIIAIIVLFCRVSFVFELSFKKYYVGELRKDIVNLGLLFFVLQLGCLIRYGCDSLFIHSFFSDEMVTKYSVITTFYMAGNALYSVVMVHLWSAVTAAAANNNWLWIRKSVYRLLGFWGFYSFGVVFVSILFNDIVRIWLGDKACLYELSLILAFASFNIIDAFNSIFVNVANGLGKLKSQIVCSFLGIIIYLPIAYFFSVVQGMQLTGLKISGVICVLIGTLIIPYFTVRYISCRGKVML